MKFAGLMHTVTNLSKLLESYRSPEIMLIIDSTECIDQEALVEALKTKQIWGAGLDVMVPEPLPVDHPLVSLSNCGK